MEHLFSPCTRYQDLIESQDRLKEFRVQDDIEELNLDVSAEEFLSAERAFTYADLDALLEYAGTVAWLTPYVFIMRAG
jgi:hypothetical protein